MVLLPMRRVLYSQLKIVGDQKKLKMAPILLILGLMLFVSDSRVAAQTASNSPKSDNKQWLSHQMFQPLPRNSEQLTNSDKVVEEIKKLYMEAEKEIETQNPSNVKHQRPQ
jgi:hypothetical protein